MTARLLLLASLLLPAFAAAETIVTTSVDRDTITVGDRLLLTIRVDAPAGTDSLLPVFPDPAIGPFEILETFPVETKTLDGVRTDVARFAITAFESRTFSSISSEFALAFSPSIKYLPVCSARGTFSFLSER